MKTEIKNDYETFESFVKQYPKILELAKKYNRQPGMLIELFAEVGKEVLNRSNDKLIEEIFFQTKTIISAKNIKLSDDSIKALDGLINFIKEKSESKNV